MGYGLNQNLLGVRVQKLAADDAIAAVALVPPAGEDEGEEAE